MVQVKFIVLIVCALTVTQAFETEGTLLSMSLNEISNLNLGDINCQNTSQQQFVQLEDNLEQWADVVDHKDDIQKDINTLKQLEVILLQAKKQAQKKKIAPQQLKQINQVVTKKLKSLVLPQTASKIGQAHCEEIEQQLERLGSDDESSRSEGCDTLLKLATFLIRQLSSINQQCHQNPVTVIKIKGQIKELHIIQGGCGGGQTIDIPMGGSDEKCETPVHPNEPSTDPTKPKPKDPTDVEGHEETTDEPVPDPGNEEAGEEGTSTEETTTTEEGENAGETPAEEGETPAEGAEEGETPAEGENAGEEGETPAEGAEEGETPAEGENAGEEGETPAEGAEEGETPAEEGENAGEETPAEEGELHEPAAEEEEEGELHEPAAEEEEEGGEDAPKNGTKKGGDIPDDGEEGESEDQEELNPEEGPNANGEEGEEGTGPAEEGAEEGSEITGEEGEQGESPAEEGETSSEEGQTPAEEGEQAGEEEEGWTPGKGSKKDNSTKPGLDLPEGEEEGETGQAGEEGEAAGEEGETGQAGEEGEAAGEQGEAGEEGETEGPASEEGEEGEEGWNPEIGKKKTNETKPGLDLPEGEEEAEEGVVPDADNESEEGGEEGEESTETTDEEVEENAEEGVEPEEQEEKCQETVEITATNAADIMCALGQYLSQLAHGGSPADSPSAKKVCFCLKYEPDNADPSLLQITQKVNKKQRIESDGLLKALIPNRRI